MNRTLITLILAALPLGAVTTPALADDAAAVKVLAGVMAGLNHFPSAEEKEQLSGIAGDMDNSEAVRTIALALRDMQHSVAPAAKDKLVAIAASDEASAEASAEVRQLADILADLNHVPSAEAKAQLEALQ